MKIDLGYAVLVLSLYVLAVARLTRLVNYDAVFDPIRLRVFGRANAARAAVTEASGLGQVARAEMLGGGLRRWNAAVYFIGCPWCVGFWLALSTAILPVLVIGWPWWALFPVGLAASHLVGVFDFAADTEDVEIEDDDG